MTMGSSEIIFWKRALQKYVHICIFEKLFTKTQSLQAHFLEWHLMRFGKGLIIYFTQ